MNELREALSAAMDLADRDSIAIEFLYRYATDFAMKNRGITDVEKIKNIYDKIEERRKSDWIFDYECISRYKFNFVDSYAYSHVIAGFIDENDYGHLLDDIVDSIDPFGEDKRFKLENGDAKSSRVGAISVNTSKYNELIISQENPVGKDNIIVLAKSDANELIRIIQYQMETEDEI